MANHQPARLRLRPNEHRALLFVGDLLMGVISVFAAAYSWREYQRYLLAADGYKPRVVEQYPNLVLFAPAGLVIIDDRTI
jgi:hypothetical protein